MTIKSLGQDPTRALVRRATAADLAAVVDFNLRLAWESEGRELERAVLTLGVRAVLEDPAKGVYFVAEVAGRVEAQVMVTVEWSDWRNGPIWWLQSVYVAVEHRGRGLFAALFREVVEAAERAGAPLLRLYVEAENLSAQEVYRKMGMTRSSYRIYELELEKGPPGS